MQESSTVDKHCLIWTTQIMVKSSKWLRNLLLTVTYGLLLINGLKTFKSGSMENGKV